MVIKVLLLLSVVLLTASNLGLNDIWQPNEAFYAETAREMLENGNYLDPTYNYGPRLNKPPLVYWLTALSYEIFGINELATRLPPLLSAFGTTLLLIYYGRKLKDLNFGLTAAFIFLLALQVFALARYDSPELPLTFFLTGSFIFLHLHLREGGFLKLTLSGLFLSLALLTKGIPFLALYFGLVFAYPLSERFLFGEPVKVGRILKASFVGVLASLPLLGWYLYAYLHHGELFVETFLSEVVHRAVNPERGLRPFFYLVVVLWSFLPFSLLFYYSLPGLLMRFRQYRYLLFPALWVGIVFGAFTVAKGKIPVYVLPAFPAMALLTARLDGLKHRAVSLISLLSVAVMFATTLFVALYFGFLTDELFLLVFLLSLILLYALREDPLWRVGISTIPFLALFVFWLLPLVEKYRPYKEILSELKKEYPDHTLATVGFYYHNFPFYWKGKVYRLRSWEEFEKLNLKKALVFTPNPPKGWKVVKKVRLFTGSESRFIVFLRDLKEQKRFREFYFAVKP